jgi:hypothetical protein
MEDIGKNDMMEGTYGDKNIYSTPAGLAEMGPGTVTEQYLSKALLDSAFTPKATKGHRYITTGLAGACLIYLMAKKVIYHFWPLARIQCSVCTVT